MEEQTKNNPDQTFLSRGCCQPPQLQYRNEGRFSHGCSKLDSYDWLKDLILPDTQEPFDCIEVRFKNSRKDFYRIPDGAWFHAGDIVAVEASPGHDIGIVTLSGEVVRWQMRKKRVNPGSEELKKVYRKARISDIEKWISVVGQEDQTMHNARHIVSRIGLKMKLNDVEYQGDGTKAIFYYTADERVDFRELIKLLAESFKVRIEMRQIGVRQESGRLGGIGTCGRELCCATWLTDFRSVSTNMARVQQLSPNPQKLAGQCGKLKCCLSYEYAVYVDALKQFPNNEIILKTTKGEAIHQKTDVFSQIMWYSYVADQNNVLAIPVDKVREIIENNMKGLYPDKLEDFAKIKERKVDFENAVGQDDLRRFDAGEEISVVI
ncbi:MAG TPA: regulatory iron-sulfur-containing complex subunit RicT [Bacteroidales bacterium]|nr:regulatory iron-sulfur-containing complex subunit RicT [Bacteroidales bacterium]HNS45866.1 regulatory iron-sulfur-containing complex subunit RicT [Bacteroidales bacterium]